MRARFDQDTTEWFLPDGGDDRYRSVQPSLPEFLSPHQARKPDRRARPGQFLQTPSERSLANNPKKTVLNSCFFPGVNQYLNSLFR
jgi:hypothetical protein